MKYGLIVHIKTQNIGDDIQEYAMEKFLPHLDYLIDREHLDSFYTVAGEKVAALLGGWHLWKAINWPPSPFLKCLPISFHLTNGAYRTITLTDYGEEWLKNIAPIGCRDEGTTISLISRGVAAYFSGCFTLTIKPFNDVEPHGKIVLADVPKEVVDFIKTRTKKEIVLVSHDYKSPSMPKEVVDFAEIHDTKEIILTSHYPEIRDESYPKNFYKGNWSYRRAFTEGLLRFYQGASLVVTNRLHASLPCLALGTPVLMVNSQQILLNDHRISSYLPYLNHTTPENLLSGKYAFNFDAPRANSRGHEKFAEKIRSVVTDFITSCENDTNKSLVDVETWSDGQKRSLRLKKLMQMLVPSIKTFL